MPSTVVHVALAGLVGAALLAEHFDKKAILAVMAAVAFLDLDVFVGMVLPGTHRAAFHTLLLPGLLGALLLYDLRVRKWSVVRDRSQADSRERSWMDPRSWVGPRSLVRSRWGARGVRVSWVGVVAITFAGIGPDLFFNGVNVFYPVHDRFYTFSGEILYSNQRGFVQTLVEVNLGDLLERVSEAGSQSGAESGGGSGAGANGGGDDPAPTTENTHYRTGFDPARGETSEDVERLFPIAMTGERALLALTGYTVVGLRLWMGREDE